MNEDRHAEKSVRAYVIAVSVRIDYKFQIEAFLAHQILYQLRIRARIYQACLAAISVRDEITVGPEQAKNKPLQYEPPLQSKLSFMYFLTPLALKSLTVLGRKYSSYFPSFPIRRRYPA